jgi:hypothetical protein
MRSTARYLGRMEISGRIPKANVLLSDVDLEKMPKDGEVSFGMKFQAPCFLGFRQLDLERWTATRLYYLEFANPDSVPSMELPLTLKIKRADVQPEDRHAEEKREVFEVDEIADAKGDPMRKSDVKIRLQTESSAAGYWRDTGALNVP